MSTDSQKYVVFDSAIKFHLYEIIFSADLNIFYMYFNSRKISVNYFNVNPFASDRVICPLTREVETKSI